jgi:hypothetical protein
MVDPIQIESPQANINRARFAGKDFFTFVDDIIARIQALFVTEFNDFVTSGTGQMLIDIVAWACETLSFYIDRQATESYLATARTRKAISRLARQLGYKMSASVSATTDLDVNLEEIQTFDVPIPVGFKFQGPNDLVFEAVEEVTFPAGEGPASPSRSVGVREGETRVEFFASDGSKNQIFRLNPQNGRFIAGNGFVCRVAGFPWTESDIITFDLTDQFEVAYNDEPPTIRFGDGIAGNIPTAGAEIRVEYVANHGKSGAVQSGTIDDVVSPLVVAATIIPLVITNPEPTSAGADREDLEQARANAQKFYHARDVAVTRTDYEGLSTAYVDALAGAVAVAQAFAAHSADDDIQLQIYLDNIRAIVNPLATDVQAATALISTDLADLDDARDTANTAVDDMTTGLGSIGSGENQARQELQAIKTSVVAGNDQVDAYGPSGTGDLTAGQANAIKGWFNSIDSDADDALADLDNIKSGYQDVLELRQEADIALDLMPPLISSIEAQVLVINTRVSTGFETAVETELQNIFNHVDGWLSADCRANLVQVPILTRDVDGFLQEPSIALINSLRTYLDARKEVTQVPEVVSGGAYLVPAVITITVGVLEGFVRQTVLSNVQKAVDDLLRVRAFGASLRVANLDTVISPNPQTGVGGIDGVSYSVVNILGSYDSSGTIVTTFLDADGNLVISEKYVITKGLVTLTAEEAAA